MKRLSILAAAIVAAAVSLRADVGFVDLPSDGTPVVVADGGKVAWIVAAETNTATAGTSYVAPKDKVMLSAPADYRSRTTIAIER